MNIKFTLNECIYFKDKIPAKMVFKTFIWIPLSILVTVFACNSPKEFQKLSHLDQIKKERMEKDLEFSDIETSPLTGVESIADFMGLKYYPIDSNYRIEVYAEMATGEKPFKMATTKGHENRYLKYYILHFSLNGQSLELAAFQNLDLIDQKEYKDYLFVPFKDLTNGDETYGGGRYVELNKNGTDTLTLDFNQAYNPYCSYNPRYSCPIPPQENHLPIAVKSGEKILYADH